MQTMCDFYRKNLMCSVHWRRRCALQLNTSCTAASIATSNRASQFFSWNIRSRMWVYSSASFTTWKELNKKETVTSSYTRDHTATSSRTRTSEMALFCERGTDWEIDNMHRVCARRTVLCNAAQCKYVFLHSCRFVSGIIESVELRCWTMNQNPTRRKTNSSGNYSKKKTIACTWL